MTSLSGVCQLVGDAAKGTVTFKQAVRCPQQPLLTRHPSAALQPTAHPTAIQASVFSYNILCHGLFFEATLNPNYAHLCTCIYTDLYCLHLLPSALAKLHAGRADGPVTVEGRIEGLAPGRHALVVHAYGDITNGGSLLSWHAVS